VNAVPGPLKVLYLRQLAISAGTIEKLVTMIMHLN
jgi:hypothetical protein